jgi:hypothetical protein
MLALLQELGGSMTRRLTAGGVLEVEVELPAAKPALTEG